MDLANMRAQGVRTMVAYCLNYACRHTAVIDVWSYLPETTITYFQQRVVCAKCGARRNKINVMPNWKEADPVKDWRGHPIMPGGD